MIIRSGALCNNLHHRLLRSRSSFPPFFSYIQDGIHKRRREDQETRINTLALFVQLEDELDTNAEVGATAANGPKEVRVFCRTSGQDRPVCYDHGGLGHSGRDADKR